MFIRADNDREGIGAIGTITDISERRMFEASQIAHAQEREASARKRAEEADERRRGQGMVRLLFSASLLLTHLCRASHRCNKP